MSVQSIHRFPKLGKQFPLYCPSGSFLKHTLLICELLNSCFNHWYID